MHRTLTDTFLTKLVTSVNEYLEGLTVGKQRCVTHRELLRILCVRCERDIAGKTTFSRLVSCGYWDERPDFGGFY
jgi:hypothetical protein